MPHENENSEIVENDDFVSKGFDKIWEILPHGSVYQFRIVAFAGYCAFTSGFMSMYPVKF